MIKELSFSKEYVTCLTCDLCYDHHGAPTYCQLGKPVNPRDIFKNQEVAALCPSWFPRKISRVYCGPEYNDDERWYEKDSMA